MAARPVRVLELIARLNIGGPAVLVIDLAAGLDPARFQVSLAAGRVGPGEDQMDFWAEARKIQWHQVPGLSPELGSGNLIAFRAISRLLARERPDVLHTHTAKAGALGRLAALRQGAGRPRLVHTFHGHVFAGYFSPPKSRLFLAIERFLARRSDCLIVLSQEQAEDICRRYRVCSSEKVRVIPAGLDLEPFTRARPGGLRASLGLAPEVFLIGFVGRLTKVKDPLTLIRALAELKARLARPAALAIIGDGELRGPVEAEAARLGVSEAVLFLGWRQDMPQVYADLDALVLASLNEGLPLVLLEALAAGRPVVATPVGGVPSLLGLAQELAGNGFVRGARGLAFSVGRPEGLAQALTWVIAHQNEALALGLAGREYVMARHGREAFLTAHTELYRSLAGVN